MRAHDEKTGGLVMAGLLAVAVSLAGLAGAVKIAQVAVTLGPNVGDILQFDPHASIPVDVKTKIDVTRAGAGACILDVATLHSNGGSLLVEQTRRAGTNASYVVHWAGQRTADGAGDCGREADLAVDSANLDTLAMAAGGWGIHRTHLQSSDLWTGNATGRMVVR